ncbi:protein TIF31 [Coniosporium apollinis CBS 100218]|uniref:Clustered mitochondria protein homolog n=1 Tax=Coniosporium apollinis (strain CBS 100218) TaxID=1168221 RepID=R7YNH0_CONA1|nr:protein TIF31 [Coniosporium apollinis CBS 100218]EON63470.1 protein TIF31 [Coniosporium apollinis CBS 100218]
MAANGNDAVTTEPAPSQQALQLTGDEKLNGELSNGDGSGHGTNDAPDDSPVFAITIKLPHEPHETQVTVSTQEQVQDIRQSIVELPFTYQYTCFHLEHNGERINDYVELSEVPGISPESELTLVEDPYTEKEARMHFIRIRDLIGAAGDRTDTLHGISAGLTLLDAVMPEANGHSPKYPGGGSDVLSSYDFEAPGSYMTLLPQNQAPPSKTIKSISLSPWNPPPYHLRAKGHLLYLQVTTNEGEQYHITSHVSGFYVNKSSNSKFDPSPKSTIKEAVAHSLLTLLSKISPSFENSFKAYQEYTSKKDPIASFQLSNAIPASPWLVLPHTAPANAHQPDIARTQENYLLTGAEVADSLRDWNEEFQSTRELPKDGVQERVFRERLTSKLFADYTEAATRGAILVARGEVTPLNPTEGRDAQIFVYNNVFFSFGADGVGTFATDGGDEAARVATGKDVMGVKAVNQLDITGLFTPGTVVVDYLGKRIVGQSIVPGIFKQREPGEHQIDYGGVEGKDVVAEDPAFAPLFEQLSKAMHVKKHPVWDKEGKCHELEGSVETKGLLGTDGRKYALDLYRVTPLDVAWLEQYWTEPEKDDQEKDEAKNYPHRMAVLRPELVEAYGRVKLRDFVREKLAKRSATSEDTDTSAETKAEPEKEESEKEESEKDESEETAVVKAEPETAEPEKKEPEQDRVDISGFDFALNPDVFCGQTPQTEEEKAQWEKDEAEVRAVCKHLTDEIIPRLLHDLQEGDVGFPMDGQSLGALLHRRGINMRYLGMIATLADKENPRLQALRRLAIQEMVARGFKHVANKKMRYLPAPFATTCLAHLLNCLLGTGLNDKPTAQTDDDLKPLYPEADFSFEKSTPESLQQEVKAQISMRYRFDLANDWVQEGKQLQMLREVSLKLGLQLEAKDYAFTKGQNSSGSDAGSDIGAPPQTNGHVNGASKKKKKNADRSPSRVAASPSTPPMTFLPDDIQNIVPVVKEASPKSVLAEEALDAGRVSIAQDQKELGQELLLESLSLHEQIYGVLHPEVARVYHQLSTLLYGLDEKNAALEVARKAVIVFERTVGVDSADTVLSYLNLALFEHATGNTATALAYVRHALELWKIVYGLRHPDSITTINNAAVMFQAMKAYHESRVWFEACLAISEEVSGKNSVGTATVCFQLSQALALDKDTHAAVDRMRESYKIFKNELGAEDRNTKEAASWLEQLTQSAVSVAKQNKLMEARRGVRRVQLTPRTNLRPQPQVGQSLAEAVGREAVAGRDPRSIEELLKYIEGDSAKKTTPKKRQANPKRRGQGAR